MCRFRIMISARECFRGVGANRRLTMSSGHWLATAPGSMHEATDNIGICGGSKGQLNHSTPLQMGCTSRGTAFRVAMVHMH